MSYEIPEFFETNELLISDSAILKLKTEISINESIINTILDFRESTAVVINCDNEQLEQLSDDRYCQYEYTEVETTYAIVGGQHLCHVEPETFCLSSFVPPHLETFNV